MFKHNLNPRVLALLFVGATAPAPFITAQELTLFEALDRVEEPLAPSNRPARDGQSAGGPEFVLVGTSRIGSHYSAILTHRSGETVVVKSSGDQVVPIEGYGGFAVAGFNPGQVVINYPTSAPCVDAQDRGVSCVGGTTRGELRLVNAEPLEPRATPVSELEVQGQALDEAVDAATAETQVNPFAALRSRAQAQGQDAGQVIGVDQGRRVFSPRRINPEEVPPGMRVVTTPFGDRLVNQ